MNEIEEFEVCKSIKEDEEKYTAMFEGIQLLVNNLVHDLLSFPRAEASDMGADCEDSFDEDFSTGDEEVQNTGENLGSDNAGHSSASGVLLYAKHVISTGLLYKEFVDSICEGDGLRALRCWRFFLPLFKSANRKNYAIEALNLLVQYHYIFPPRQAEQLLWSRFVNTLGWAGHNIPCDLHLEHLNRACKTAINALGANITEKTLLRTGKCIGPLTKVLNNYDSENELKKASTTHSSARANKDIQTIVKQLEDTNVFSKCSVPRAHRSFSKLQQSIYLKLSRKKIIVWMNDTVAQKYPAKN